MTWILQPVLRIHHQQRLLASHQKWCPCHGRSESSLPAQTCSFSWSWWRPHGHSRSLARAFSPCRWSLVQRSSWLAVPRSRQCHRMRIQRKWRLDVVRSDLQKWKSRWLDRLVRHSGSLALALLQQKFPRSRSLPRPKEAPPLVLFLPKKYCLGRPMSNTRQRRATGAATQPSPSGSGASRLRVSPGRVRARCLPTPRLAAGPRHRAVRGRRGRQWDVFRSCTGLSCLVIRSCSMRRALASWLRLVLSPQPISSAISAWSYPSMANMLKTIR